MLIICKPLEKIRSALARAGETPRAQWSWGILAADEMIGLIALFRRSPVMGTISYILREDTWGNGYATNAAQQVVAFALTTAGLEWVEAMHHPANPASGRVLANAGFTRIGTTDQPAADGSAVPYETYALQHRTSRRPRRGLHREGAGQLSAGLYQVLSRRSWVWEDDSHGLHLKGPCLVEHQLHFGRGNAAGVGRRCGIAMSQVCRERRMPLSVCSNGSDCLRASWRWR
ncbi:GNAT family N-acetyltransferase [Streptomyces sp. NPDC059851]|uniref:GNAT family N-acetyltransferase n=1 Tax=Streptomyces sp. NPDC059851 TaxID=3346971 RepID=UPI0036463DD7